MKVNDLYQFTCNFIYFLPHRMFRLDSHWKQLLHFQETTSIDVDGNHKMMPSIYGNQILAINLSCPKKILRHKWFEFKLA